jgi:hypothetical protein
MRRRDRWIGETASCTRWGLELEMATRAPCSMQASATDKPMPLDPPMMRMREPASLEVYLVESDMVVVGMKCRGWEEEHAGIVCYLLYGRYCK